MLTLLVLVTSDAYAPEGALYRQEWLQEIENSPCQNISATKEERNVACQIESVAKKHGLSKEETIALLVNSYAESRFDPNAVSPGKKSYGVFQLHVDGMGYGWSKEDMLNIELATEAVVLEMKKNNLVGKNHSIKTSTKKVCKKVLRPKHSDLKAEERARMISDLFPKKFLLK